MDENFVGNVIGAGIGLAVIDRVAKPRRKRKTCCKRKSGYQLRSLSGKKI